MRLAKYRANLINITEVGSVPEKLLPFVEFKANQEGIELNNKEMVAVLNIATTESYLPIFFNKTKNIEDIEREVQEGASAELDTLARRAIIRFLNENK